MRDPGDHAARIARKFVLRAAASIFPLFLTIPVIANISATDRWESKIGRYCATAINIRARRHFITVLLLNNGHRANKRGTRRLKDFYLFESLSPV